MGLQRINGYVVDSIAESLSSSVSASGQIPRRLEVEGRLPERKKTQWGPEAFKAFGLACMTRPAKIEWHCWDRQLELQSSESGRNIPIEQHMMNSYLNNQSPVQILYS